MKTLALALFLGLAASTRAAEPASTASAPQGLKPGLVDAATARTLAASGVRVVDVRTPAEFAAGHVPGALNIPFEEMERRHAELGPPSTPVLLYCRSGRRSGIAAEVLRGKGFDRLYDFQTLDRWVAAGGAVQTGSSTQ
ncbi:MAG: rhodanese-like domain-containing protein [Deltaproteobacteria bacterium]|nr:rhodanese-like domain-containing protein [Deltaproteobacteria bacterium]